VKSGPVYREIGVLWDVKPYRLVEHVCRMTRQRIYIEFRRKIYCETFFWKTEKEMVENHQRARR
jgi:hypothetical protein